MMFFLVANGQTLRAIDDTASTYVMGFGRKNDVRVHFTPQRYILRYGSTREGSTEPGLFTNVTSLLGGGFTYKFLDLDLAFSLPKLTRPFNRDSKPFPVPLVG